ncbi:MAG: cytochrome C552 [Proteobacteria bacterium]|nr:MAG: cytochrome C552 [Pseudomonadota bacterium]
MSRRSWVSILLALVIVPATLLPVRLHNAGGASLEQDHISAGRRLAEAWCVKCHSLDATTSGTPRRAPDFAVIANRTSTTGPSLKVFLHSNHRNMPDMMFSPEQADDLAYFILSLKGG